MDRNAVVANGVDPGGVKQPINDQPRTFRLKFVTDDGRIASYDWGCERGAFQPAVLTGIHSYHQEHILNVSI